GLTVLQLEQLALVQQSFITLNDFDGLAISGDQLVLWARNRLAFYQLLPGGELAVISEQVIAGEVLNSQVDGDIFWLQLDEPSRGIHWVAYQQHEVVGYFAPIGTELVVGEHGLAHFNGRQINQFAFTGVELADSTESLNPTLTHLAHGYLISNYELTRTTTYLNDSNGALVPSQKVWVNHQSALFVARGSFTGELRTLTRTEHSGRVTTADLTVNLSPSTAVTSITPVANSVFSKGALVPVIAQYPGTALINEQSLLIENVPSALTRSIGDASAGWLLAPAQANVVGVELLLNQTSQGARDLTLVNNNFELGGVTLLSPRNNQLFVEGDSVDVNYAITDDGGETFHYVEITLLDFNKNILMRQLANAQSGTVSLRLGALSEQDNYQLRVRGFYGDSYRYNEAEAGIRVIPKRDQLTIAIEGVGDKVYRDSEVTLKFSSILPEGVTPSLKVQDNEGNILVVGSEQVSFTVPDVTSLVIDATVSDGYGNDRLLQKMVRVINPISLLTHDIQQDFSAALAGVDIAYFARGVGLYDQNGTQLHR
ncbi:MAG: hypothetical protein MJK04_16155, partial [Psychrosphaera sp.]|nr:hypothetical protein [Psychrosphaera sp.]